MRRVSEIRDARISGTARQPPPRRGHRLGGDAGRQRPRCHASRPTPKAPPWLRRRHVASGASRDWAPGQTLGHVHRRWPRDGGARSSRADRRLSVCAIAAPICWSRRAAPAPAELAAHMIDKVPPDTSKMLLCPMPGAWSRSMSPRAITVEAGQATCHHRGDEDGKHAARRARGWWPADQRRAGRQPGGRSCHRGIRVRSAMRRNRPPSTTGKSSPRKSCGAGTPDDLTVETPEGIALQPVYTEADLQGIGPSGRHAGLRALSARPQGDHVCRAVPGRSASMPASRRPRNPTPSTAATSPPGRRACRSPSISPPIAAMTATIPA